MIIKVCGMRDADNIRAVEALGIDWMGFIFYPKSKRYVGDSRPSYLPGESGCKRVGVFVNEDISTVCRRADEYSLDIIQLHGNESADYCRALKESLPKIQLIKAVSLPSGGKVESSETLDIFKGLDSYEGLVTHFLFDTASIGYGGSGERFDWSVLNLYKGGTPFLLSGGLGHESLTDLQSFRHSQWVGIDLNSRFELYPGFKSVESLKSFIEKLNGLSSKNMNRINQLFQTKGSNILSIYFCAGAPTLNGPVDVIRTLESKGVDMIEIGIPFSDPMADGPTIQAAATKALRNGMSLKLLFEQLKDIRQSVSIPLLMMGYLNPIMHFGFEAFCQKCHECGIDGLIIPDLPFKDYIEEFKPVADRYDIRIIMLITPETSDERIHFIDDHTDGFIYMVSSASTTGAQKCFDDSKQAYFNKVNAMALHNPRMIGFGISNRQTLEAAQGNAAGAIIGSKFVSLLDESASPSEAMDRLLDCLSKD